MPQRASFHTKTGRFIRRFEAAPWLLRAIASIAERYPMVQVIVSSRMSGSYLEAVPFFGVTLLPFSNDQRNTFIGKWFGSATDSHAIRIFKHLRKNPSVAEIVRNPLLATILCVVEANSIELPTNELKLYDEREKLLSGHYDLVKGARRTITSQSVLEETIRRLAHALHSRSKRDEEVAGLYRIVQDIMRPALSGKAAQLAVDELIDPCNLLVPMTQDGRFGLGHLRHQEYLAAKELASNRGIDLLPLLDQSWWRGVLVLFSQMNQDINWLIHEVLEKARTEDVQATLLAMIAVRPRHERAALRKIVNENAKLDGLDFTFRISSNRSKYW